MFRQFLAAEGQKKTPADEQYIEELSNVPSAYRLYQKDWANESVKDKYNQLRQAKIDAIEAKQAEELKKRKIYTREYERGASVVGLDNGFSTYKVRGPIVKIVYFTDKEIAELGAEGLKTEFSDGSPLLYKRLTYQDGGSIGYNKKRSKEYDSISYYMGGITIMEDYDGYVGEYTRYESTFGKVWYSPIEADPRPPSDPQAGKTFAELHKGIQGM